MPPQSKAPLIQPLCGCGIQPTGGAICRAEAKRSREWLRWVTNAILETTLNELWQERRQTAKDAKDANGILRLDFRVVRVVRGCIERRNGFNPFRVENILGNVNQGSSFLATLG